MSTSAIAASRRSGMLAWFLLAYFAASALDLGTTSLALLRPGAAEANMFATSSGIYSALKGIALTLFGAAGMGWMFAFGLRHADRIEERWLRHPVRSFACFYINPWAPGAIVRSPLHLASYAIAFVVLRLLAAGNNLLIAAGDVGPLGLAVREAGRLTTPVAGFALAIGGAYLLITVAVSPLAARLMRLSRSV